MHDFRYRRAASLEDAAAAAADGARLLAGGTELLNWMRLGIDAPEDTVDIGRLDALRGVTAEGREVRIGALATLNEIEASPLIRREAPVLSRACLKSASAQLRNLATIGGNVLQKTRCPYFRAEAPGRQAMPWPCNKRAAGSGCAALDGDYGRAALFGWTEACVATHPSDPAVALSALGATVEVHGTDGPRRLAMTDFHLTQEEAEALGDPGSDGRPPPVRETRLRPGDVIVAYRIPLDEAARSSAYLKVRERESYEYALVSAAACVDRDGATIRTARVALGSIAQKPWRLVSAEASLTGRTLDRESIIGPVEQALSDARPRPGQEPKVRLAANAAVRAILMAGGRADD